MASHVEDDVDVEDILDVYFIKIEHEVLEDLYKNSRQDVKSEVINPKEGSSDGKGIHYFLYIENKKLP